ncbi:MAG: hypothetical protein ACRESO_05605, partial [Gammaproteobacteria bacterium]
MPLLIIRLHNIADLLDSGSPPSRGQASPESRSVVHKRTLLVLRKITATGRSYTAKSRRAQRRSRRDALNRAIIKHP